MPSESMDRWREWIEIQLDRAWMFYWKADVEALEQLAQKVEPHLVPHATAAQRAEALEVTTADALARAAHPRDGRSTSIPRREAH